LFFPVPKALETPKIGFLKAHQRRAKIEIALLL
jgi:hypothetical protein